MLVIGFVMIVLVIGWKITHYVSYCKRFANIGGIKTYKQYTYMIHMPNNAILVREYIDLDAKRKQLKAQIASIRDAGGDTSLLNRELQSLTFGQARILIDLERD